MHAVVFGREMALSVTILVTYSEYDLYKLSDQDLGVCAMVG